MSLSMLTDQELLAERISRSATISLNGPIDEIFLLFGPIREKDWADGWNPEIVYSTSNLVEQHMMFRTKGRTESEPFYNWIVTSYNRDAHQIEYTVSTINRVWFITVDCRGDKKQTLATITYTYTSLNEEGARLNKTSLEKMFANQMKDWEQAINHYLKTGNILKETN